MALQEIKLDVVQKILLLNDKKVLNKISTLLDDNAVVAYSTSGKPLTLAQYSAEIELAEKDFENGNTHTHEEVKKIVSKWKRKANNCLE